MIKPTRFRFCGWHLLGLVTLVLLLHLGCNNPADQPGIAANPDGQTDLSNSAPRTNQISSTASGTSPADADQQAAPVVPPGTMQLPPDSALPNPQTTPAVPANPLAGGFELPPLESTDAAQTVTAQRPVLDEAQSAGESPEVSLQAGTVEQVLEQAQSSGKVCVVDFWSLGCAPCLKEFPGLVALHKKYGDRLVCVSVNCDFDGRKSKPAETYRARAEAFLTASGATFKNYLCTTPNEEVYAALKTVTIPVVLVIDADGKTVKTFSDSGETRGFTYAKDVNPLIQSLLEQPSAN